MIGLLEDLGGRSYADPKGCVEGQALGGLGSCGYRTRSSEGGSKSRRLTVPSTLWTCSLSNCQFKL